MFIPGRAHTVFRLAAGTATALLLIVIGSAGNHTVHASPKAPAETVEVTILTPRNGIAVNAAALEIQALAREHRAGRGDDDIWTGWRRVELAIDGVTAQTLDPTACRGELAAGFRIDLTGLAPGAHVATVTASKRHWRGTIVHGSAALTFMIDPTLPVRERNRIEDAATPKPFACLSTPDFDRDDDNRSDDDDFHFATLRGSFVPNALSAGIDLHRDRVVIAIDGQLAVIEPGTFVCRAHNRCRFTDRGAALVRSVRLEQKGHGRWTFTIATRHRPWSPHALFLRIGANWGGLDFVHDQYVAALTPSLDAGHRAQAVIGATGGLVQTTDAAGVVIRLAVPAGALTADTSITLTPLNASPLAGSIGAIHPGVDFEPHGLQFAVPAMLTMDFSATSQVLTGAETLFLLTSPMTTVPLVGTVDPVARTLTAQVHHFSPYAPGTGASAFVDFTAWTDAATGDPVLYELDTLIALEALQQRLGACGVNCLNEADIAARLTASITTFVGTECVLDIAAPTTQALDRWLQLDVRGRQLGADTSAIQACVQGILGALINHAGVDALGDPSAVNLSRLADLHNLAEGLQFPDLARLALEKVAAVARALLAQATQTCPIDPTAGLAQLNNALVWQSIVNLDVTVDPTLLTDLQNAIDHCRPATITAGAAASVSGQFGPCGDETPCVSNVHSDEESFRAGVPFRLTPLPLALSTFGVSVFVSQPSPNVIAVDAVATSDPTSGIGGRVLEVGLQITQAQPGTISVVRNEQWGIACVPPPSVVPPGFILVKYVACPVGGFNGSGGWSRLRSHRRRESSSGERGRAIGGAPPSHTLTSRVGEHGARRCRSARLSHLRSKHDRATARLAEASAARRRLPSERRSPERLAHHAGVAGIEPIGRLKAPIEVMSCQTNLVMM